MDFDPTAFVSAIGGGGAVLGIAKWALNKALKELDAVSRKVAAISEALAAVCVRLEKLADHESILREHSVKIAFFEGKDDSRRAPRSVP